MGALLKAILQYCHITDMGKMNPAHSCILACHADYVVLRGASQGTGAQSDAIVAVIHQL